MLSCDSSCFQWPQTCHFQQFSHQIKTVISLQTGYYMPKVDVIRRDYQIMQPALTDLQFAGINIMMECTGFNSYKLEKREPLKTIFGM